MELFHHGKKNLFSIQKLGLYWFDYRHHLKNNYRSRSCVSGRHIEHIILCSTFIQHKKKNDWSLFLIQLAKAFEPVVRFDCMHVLETLPSPRKALKWIYLGNYTWVWARGIPVKIWREPDELSILSRIKKDSFLFTMLCFRTSKWQVLLKGNFCFVLVH